MEHAFTVMLRAELTSASPNKLSALTQSALKLRPNVVARVLNNHVRQSPAEVLPPALQLAEGLCRNAGPAFKKIFETELPELFEQAWRRADRAIRSQLLKLYVAWKTTLGQEVIKSIDTKMKAAKSAKREPETPVATPIPVKRVKQELLRSPYEEMTPVPIPMQTNDSPYWSKNRDPNMIHIDSGEEDSDNEDQIDQKLPVMSLIDLLVEAAEECKNAPQSNPRPARIILPSTQLDFRNLHVYDENVYRRLVQGTKTTKPRYLDWRFSLRLERRKHNCQSRVWYAPPEVWSQDSNPKDLSPQQLLQKLSKPRSWKTDDILRVPIDDANPQSYCVISGDVLEKSFDEKSGKWHYMNCRKLQREEALANRVPEGSICLIDCIKSSYRA